MFLRIKWNKDFGEVRRFCESYKNIWVHFNAKLVCDLFLPIYVRGGYITFVMAVLICLYDVIVAFCVYFFCHVWTVTLVNKQPISIFFGRHIKFVDKWETVANVLIRWRIQDFPEVGMPTPKKTYYFAFFAEKCMEIKKNIPRDASVFGTPWNCKCNLSQPSTTDALSANITFSRHHESLLPWRHLGISVYVHVNVLANWKLRALTNITKIPQLPNNFLTMLRLLITPINY